MARLSRITAIVGIVGYAATKFGVLSVLPMQAWLWIAVAGVVATIIFRRPSD